jgi:hypothetical protein
LAFATNGNDARLDLFGLLGETDALVGDFLFEICYCRLAHLGLIFRSAGAIGPHA